MRAALCSLCSTLAPGGAARSGCCALCEGGSTLFKFVNDFWYQIIYAQGTAGGEILFEISSEPNEFKCRGGKVDTV